MQMLLDCCDGEVARWRNTSSPKGVFLDRVGHYVTEGLIPIALGLRAAGFPEAGWAQNSWAFIGAVLAVLVLWNKALNDMVHVSRAYNGLPKLSDVAGVGTPQSSGLRRLRSVARLFPFYRAYHSVELTLLALLAGVVDAFTGDLAGTQFLVAALAILGVVTYPNKCPKTRFLRQQMSKCDTLRVMTRKRKPRTGRARMSMCARTPRARHVFKHAVGHRRKPLPEKPKRPRGGRKPSTQNPARDSPNRRRARDGRDDRAETNRTTRRARVAQVA